jgi:sec-independent protein translocase protein TatB
VVADACADSRNVRHRLDGMPPQVRCWTHAAEQQEVSAAGSAFESSWKDATTGLTDGTTPVLPLEPPPPVYKRPNKKWRLKRGATPVWFKQRQGIRRQAQSGAARVARFRPPRAK